MTGLYILLFLLFFLYFFFRFHPVFGASLKHIQNARVVNSKNYKDGAFYNLEETPMMTEAFSPRKLLYEYLKGNPNGKPKKKLTSVQFDLTNWNKEETNLAAWFGHSTLLLKLNGKNILFDPVFSTYASPIPFTNKAFNYTNKHRIEDLPHIDVLVLSHDHYDHMDYSSIKKLKHKTSMFMVPLGVDAHLLRWGISKEKIKALDWNETFLLDENIQISALPARHFSGRKPGKRNDTLWASWALETKLKKVYFSGDSAYGTHFKRIGEKFKTFDLCFLECGQYHEYWKFIHSMPEETVLAAKELNAKAFFPIHRRKFKLSLHDWFEPEQRVIKASEKEQVSMKNALPGEIFLF